MKILKFKSKPISKVVNVTCYGEFHLEILKEKAIKFTQIKAQVEIF
jgi:uncharacterized phage-like protein YoqJ